MKRRDFLKSGAAAAAAGVAGAAGISAAGVTAIDGEIVARGFVPVNISETTQDVIRTSDLSVVSYEKATTLEDGLTRERIDLCVYLQTVPDLLGIRVGESYTIVVDHQVADMVLGVRGEDKEPLKFSYKFTGVCTENSLTASVGESAIVTLCFEGIR